MKLLIISDPHGTNHWEKIKKLDLNKIDKIIFLGDYFDSFTIGFNRQMSNAKQIIKFKLANREKVCLCWGNHCTSYYLDERCSGWQHMHTFDIEEFFRINKILFEVAFIFDKWIFTHAGVSKEWMKCSGIKKPTEINDLFKSRPNFFRHVGPDPFGQNPNEGPLWIRPQTLQDYALRGWNQCVGHTAVVPAPAEYISINDDKLLIVDAPTYDCFVELDTETDKWKVI